LKDGTWKSFKTSNGLLSDEIDWIVADGHTIWFTQADKGVGRLEQFYGLNEKVYLPLVNQ
jgi:hypothetical protein